MTTQGQTSISDHRVRIIHLEDDMGDLALVAEMLAAGGLKFDVIHACDLETFENALKTGEADIIISDYSLPGYDGLRALQLAQQIRRSVPFIFFSGTLGEETAVISLKNGATDYVLKQHPDRLVASVHRALVEARERAARRHAEEELNRRDALLRQVMENVEDLVTVVDLEGRRVLSSPSHQNIFGEDLPPGSDFLAEIHPGDRDRVREAFLKTITLKTSHGIQYRLFTSRSGIRFMEARGSIIRNDTEHPEYVLWVAHDITDHKFSEEKIREQAALLDEAHDAICVNDLDQVILFWNKGAERLYGWPARDAVGRNTKDLLFENDVALTAVKTLIRHGKWHGELQQTTRSGEQITVESRWALIRDANSKPKSILVINTDITTRKKAEAKIREQAALLDKARDAIFVSDRRGRIVYWNQGAKRLYGWTPQDAIGKHADKLLFEKMPHDQAAIQEAVSERGEWFGELSQITRAGKNVIVQSRQTLVRDSNGTPTSVLYINSDITEKKQIEAQFLRTQRMENLGALAGGIAHDLNNILAPIMMAVEVIQMSHQTGVSAHPLLETIGTSARRGSELVKQILSFARGVGEEKTRLQIRHVISEVVKLIRDTFPRSIAVRSPAARDLPEILGNATQLHQVLLNLCVNARDAMPQGGTLTLAAESVQLDEIEAARIPEAEPGGYVLLRVADTGSGIPPEVIERIFEPFFTTKEIGKGTGLGLSTVIGIVKNHGGIVNVRSEFGNGTVFEIYLPAAPKTMEPAHQTPAGDPPRGNNELILVVDDEAGIREISERILGQHGYRVLTAGDGAEAIALYAHRRDQIQAVLMDIEMPVMDGVATIRILQKMEPSLKVVVCSGVGSPGVQQSRKAELTAMGVKSYLTKPYTSGSVLTAMHELLSAGQREK